MNILVTGSSGFIGSYLSKKLEVLGHNVLCFSHLDGDIQNFNFNRKYKNIEIDLIYHLAGKTFVVNLSCKLDTLLTYSSRYVLLNLKLFGLESFVVCQERTRSRF